MKRVKTRAVLFDPRDTAAWDEELTFIEKNGHFDQLRDSQKLNYLDAREATFEASGQWLPQAADVRLESLAFRCCPIEPTLDEDRFKAQLKDKRRGLVELFDPFWKTGGIGSARGAIFHRFHLKGCGLTLPHNSFEPSEHSGLLDLDIAVYSFALSHLFDSMLPLGGIRGEGVLLQEDLGPPAGLYVRGNDCARLAMMGPHPRPGDQEHWESKLQETHGDVSSRARIFRIMAQLAAVFRIGHRLEFTVDNVLADGREMDEETWVLPERWNEQSFSFVVEWLGDGPRPTTFVEDFLLENTRLSAVAFTNVRNLISRLLLAWSPYFSDLPSAIECEEMFLVHWASMLPAEDVRSWWEHGTKPITDERLWWEGWRQKGFVMSLRPMGRGKELLIHVTRKVNVPATELTRTWNDRPRSNEMKHARRLAWMFTEHGPSAEELSQAVLRRISRSSYVLPTRPGPQGEVLENVVSLAEWLTICKKRRLPMEQGDIIVWDGAKERMLSLEDPRSLPPVVLPVALRLPAENGKTWELPLPKSSIALY